MNLSKIAGELSILAYAQNPSIDGYDSLEFFEDEPDQALVVKTIGYCFAAFRGTTLNLDDWLQNFLLGTEEVCQGPVGDEQCCSTRRGFYQAYNADYKDVMEDSLRKCASDCSDPDECVVLTGHSQEVPLQPWQPCTCLT